MDVLEKKLIENKQEHIIPYLNKKKVREQIEKIDFEELNNLCIKAQKNEFIVSDNIKPVQALNPKNINIEEIKLLINKGEKVIRSGKYAVVTMAGGQGTRLGHNGPKGGFELDICNEKKTLFKIIAESLIRENNNYNVTIPWYIMTSKENNKDTIELFEKNNYYEYPKDFVKFFKQEEMPIITTEGKLLINSYGYIKEASNGNGAIFSSMKKNGIIDEMKEKGIDWVFIGAIDNILLKVADPLLLGLSVRNKTEVASKTVLKNAPNEKVGVFCKQNGKIKVIEYSELSKGLSEEKNENGELLYGESHIMCNLFSINALEKAASNEMKYHVAVKNIKGIQCYKFEKFIFDAFSLFDEISILRGKREEDFAPIKNKDGIDSPETALKLYKNYWGI